MEINPGKTSVFAQRVAFFTDSFNEVNGVALTSRMFANFARSHFYPFFAAYPGPRNAHCRRGSFETFEVERSQRLLHLEHDLSFDLLFLRHRKEIRRAVAAFRPDLVHITGPGHMGMLGAFIAHDLGVPLVASWHTNVHEYGARRLRKMLARFGKSWTNSITEFVEDRSLDLTVRFYKLAKMMFAPNPELVQMLATRSNRPVHIMQRGIDSELFSSEKRRNSTQPFTIGYVGRLSAEKNVRMFLAMEDILNQWGLRDYRFLIVGEGSERAWLQQNLKNADLPGILKGEPLAEAYASMDVFVFPSETDTFGNVTLEAMASGVPAIVSEKGGPKFLIESGITGLLASTAEEFAHAVLDLANDPTRRKQMGKAAGESASMRSWEKIFQDVYDHYREGFASGVLKRQEKTALRHETTVLSTIKRFQPKVFH